jgi:hypothetical protein
MKFKNQLAKAVGIIGIAGSLGWATAGWSAERHACLGVGSRGCSFALVLDIEREDVIASAELSTRCFDSPEETRVLGQGGPLLASTNFRPRFDNRFFGWKQFSLEGLTTGERASILIDPRTLGSANLTAHLRLVVPGQPASEALDLECSR